MFICLKNDDGLVNKGVLAFLLFSKVLKFCGGLKQTNGKKWILPNGVRERRLFEFASFNYKMPVLCLGRTENFL